MVNDREIFIAWGIPVLPCTSITLVPREHAADCVRRILQERYKLHGYEGFTYFSTGQFQPHLEWSASWSDSSRPPLAEIIVQLSEPPPEITHFNFAFSVPL